MGVSRRELYGFGRNCNVLLRGWLFEQDDLSGIPPGDNIAASGPVRIFMGGIAVPGKETDRMAEG